MHSRSYRSYVVLLIFVILTLSVTWERELYALPWMAVLAVVFTTLGLIVATHALVPQTVVLLGIAFVVEIAACFGDHLTIRVVPAFSVNIEILLMVDLLPSADGVPPDYHSASEAVLPSCASAPC